MSMPTYLRLAAPTKGLSTEQIAQRMSIFGLKVDPDTLARRMKGGRKAIFKDLTARHPGVRAYVKSGAIEVRVTPHVVGFEQETDKHGERVARPSTRRFCKQLGPVLKKAGFYVKRDTADEAGLEVFKERFGVVLPIGAKKSAPAKKTAAKTPARSSKPAESQPAEQAA